MIKTKTISKPNYIVVFDMDETLGHFEQLSIFWGALKHYCKELSQQDFYELLDIFPQFFRPKIFQILDYLKQLKESKICDKVMIYTNNNSKKWPHLIKDYFDYKLNVALF